MEEMVEVQVAVAVDVVEVVVDIPLLVQMLPALQMQVLEVLAGP